jgi:hypothetical protein
MKEMGRLSPFIFQNDIGSLTSPILFPPESHFPGFEIPKHTLKITVNSILERERWRRKKLGRRWTI